MKEDNETFNVFSKFIKEKRKALGISQADLAIKVYGQKKYKSYISEIENGVRQGITIDTMNKLLTALNSTIYFTEN